MMQEIYLLVCFLYFNDNSDDSDSDFSAHQGDHRSSEQGTPGAEQYRHGHGQMQSDNHRW